MRAVDRASDELRALLRTPANARRAVAAFEAVGAHTLADRVDRLRSDSDLVPVTVPAGSGALLSRRFRMYGLDGRDQVARALRGGGWHAFEAPLPSVVVQLVRRWPTTVLDVGANTGLYSLIAVTAHRHARAIAYEPVPEIATLLRANVAANPQGRRIAVREVAIGDRAGSAELHLPPPQADGTIETSASLEAGFKETVERVVTVETATLDGAWRAEGRPAVSLVKIDVEGAEHRVLAGASDLVSTCRPVLTVEVLRAADLAALDGLRRDHGYLDVTLGSAEAVVDNPEVRPVDEAPNHLLVPRERIDDVVHELHGVRGLSVTRWG
jgi:FkbM family methyltransferase